METENDEVINIQLRISKRSWPEMYEICKKAGPHVRAKRIASLALIGLFYENRRAIQQSPCEEDENQK